MKDLTMKQIVEVSLLLGFLVNLALQECVPESREAVASPEFPTKHVSQTPSEVTKEIYDGNSQTSTPVASPTPVSTNTSIYVAPIIPTLNSADAKQLLNRMLSQNGGCKLPCWLGIYPGETRWADARATLNSFVERIEEQKFTEPDADGNTHTIDLAYVYFERGVPSPEFSLETPGYFSVQSVDGIVQSVLAYQDTSSHFNLSDLLSEYGKPSEVYINTTFASPTGEVPFSLVVYYPNKGILAFYHENAPVVEDKIHFCAKEKGPINLEIWSPTEIITQKVKEEFITGLDYWLFDTGLHPVQDVSNLTVEQFYLNFSDTNNTTCIVTPSDRWIDASIFYIPTSTPSPTLP